MTLAIMSSRGTPTAAVTGDRWGVLHRHPPGDHLGRCAGPAVPAYQAEFEQFSLGRGQESPFRYLSQAQYQGLVWQLLEQYGLFSGTPKDRYSDGRLDEILMEALSQERVLYLSFPVTVPAGGSVTVAAAFWKAPSYDYGCSGSENVGLQGYDLVTALGSTLELTDQTAALVNTDTIEIVRQNLGFDLENGVTQVSLDLAELTTIWKSVLWRIITKTRLWKFHRRVFGIVHFFRPRIQAARSSPGRRPRGLPAPGSPDPLCVHAGDSS
mgnify:CR=1 FL=1